jgi:hypothetical protein
VNPYVVRAGDHLDLIAHKHGVTPDDIWNHPRNAALNDRRKNPNLLCFGDVIYIPEVTRRWIPLFVGASNTIVATVPKVQLSVRFSVQGAPLAGKRCVVHGIDQPLELTTDGAGKLSLETPITVQTVVVEFPDVPMVRTLCIGHLDPADEPTGAFQRLQNLGYASSRSLVGDRAALAGLLRRFQEDSGLKSTGSLDKDTIAALEAAHGC